MIELKVIVPEPCSQDWESMSPDKRGRFCDHCSKSVVDFTTMKRAELEQFITENSNQHICGRFLKTQLDSPYSRRERFFLGMRSWIEQHTVQQSVRAAMLMMISWGMFLTGCSRSYEVVGGLAHPPPPSLMDSSTANHNDVMMLGVVDMDVVNYQKTARDSTCATSDTTKFDSTNNRPIVR